MDLPRADREALYRTLLSLNTAEMVHGAFGLEGDAVVIVHALDLENLDFNEFQAVIDDVSLAIARHYRCSPAGTRTVPRRPRPPTT